MILSTGLTPAWQQILVFSEFAVGQVNRATAALACASGKVLNVGSALHQLGVHSKTLSLAGGKVGELLRADFERLGAPVRWVPSQIPTRTCTTILDQKTNLTTELVENSHAVPHDELETFFHAFVEEVRAAQTVVITGSLPDGCPKNYFRRLLEKSHARSILDIRGAELDEALATRPFIVKPNCEELARTVGRDLDSSEDIFAAMAELRARGAEWVVISQGADPLLALGPDGRLQIDVPQVDVRNPIGCGDCLAAGIAVGLDKGLSMPDSLRCGVRAAGENASHLLPARGLSRLS
ncbi:1-phosphofructokinase family hexose kinase [Schlesneria paludicola]|uniref:1-phosphofructokinase family hexose kinase n=1 Tax=Schlesneria paludicola TaxID=360056 RepID=UPI00029A9477|nr:PfkB family carbohydrate kinase [Schlesneria paludicola]